MRPQTWHILDLSHKLQSLASSWDGFAGSFCYGDTISCRFAHFEQCAQFKNISTCLVNVTAHLCITTDFVSNLIKEMDITSVSPFVGWLAASLNTAPRCWKRMFPYLLKFKQTSLQSHINNTSSQVELHNFNSETLLKFCLPKEGFPFS